MLLPNYPNGPVINLENGEMMPEWQLFFTQMSTELQLNLSNEGYNLPKLPTDSINNLTAPQSIGAIIYDDTTNEMKVNLNGTWKVVTTS